MAAVCKRNEPKEILGLNRITKKRLLELCKKDKLYQTPALNDVLYLHYQGFQCIEGLEDYTELKCLWLECNAISEIQGLENQTKLKCLFLQSNLIKKIENLEWCKELDTINLSQNHIRKIENIGVDVLPVLNTLNLSSNYIKDCEGLRNLEECKNLSVLDLSNNRIDDILVVKIFAKMPELKVLILQGNPVVSKIPQYRKTMILECKNLTYLDARPVFPKDRACAEAWKRGGYEEERKENERWNRKDRKKIRDSVNATIRMRNKHRKPEDHLTLLVSSDSEDESAASKRRRQQQELDAGINMELGIWDEVAGGDDGKSETASSSDMNVSSSTSVISTTDSNADNTSLSSKQEENMPGVGENSTEKENNISKDRCSTTDVCQLAESENADKILQFVKDNKEKENLEDCLTEKDISLANLTESQLQSLIRDNEKKEDQSEVENLVHYTELRREDDNEKQCDLIFREDRNEVKLLNCPSQENHGSDLGKDGAAIKTALSTQDEPKVNVSDEEVISSDEGPDIKETYSDTIEAIYRVTMNDLSCAEVPLKYSERLEYQQIATNDDNYEVICEMEEAMGTMITDEDKTIAKIREINSKSKGKDYTTVKTQLQLEYDRECSIVNEEVQKDFEQMSSNMDVAMAQFQREEEERKQIIEALFSKREADKEISSGGESGDGDVVEMRKEDMLRIERMVDQWDRETRLRGGRLRKDEPGEQEEGSEVEVGDESDDRNVNFHRRKLGANKEGDLESSSFLQEKEEGGQKSGTEAEHEEVDRKVNRRKVVGNIERDFESSLSLQEREDGKQEFGAETRYDVANRMRNSCRRTFEGYKEYMKDESSSSIQEKEEDEQESGADVGHEADERTESKEGYFESSSIVQEKGNDIKPGEVRQTRDSNSDLKGKQNTKIPSSSSLQEKEGQESGADFGHEADEFEGSKKGYLESSSNIQEKGNDIKPGKVGKTRESLKDVEGKENTEFPLKLTETVNLESQEGRGKISCRENMEKWHSNELDKKESTENLELTFKQLEENSFTIANPKLLQKTEEIQETHRQNEVGRKIECEFAEKWDNDAIDIKVSTENLEITLKQLQDKGLDMESPKMLEKTTGVQETHRQNKIGGKIESEFAEKWDNNDLDIEESTARPAANLRQHNICGIDRTKVLENLEELQKECQENESCSETGKNNVEEKVPTTTSKKHLRVFDETEMSLADIVTTYESNINSKEIQSFPETTLKTEIPLETAENENRPPNITYSPNEEFAYQPLDISLLTQVSNQALDSFEREAKELKQLLQRLENDNEQLFKNINAESKCEIEESTKEIKDKDKLENDETLVQDGLDETSVIKYEDVAQDPIQIICQQTVGDIVQSLDLKAQILRSYEFPHELESEDSDDIIQSLDLKYRNPKSYEFPKELESEDPDNIILSQNPQISQELESENPDDIVRSLDLKYRKPKSYEFPKELESEDPDDIIKSQNLKISQELESDAPDNIIQSQKPNNYDIPQELESEDSDDIRKSLNLKYKKPKSYEFPQELASEDPDEIIQSQNRKIFQELESEDAGNIIQSLKPRKYEFPQELESEDPDDIVRSLEKPKSYKFSKELESEDPDDVIQSQNPKISQELESEVPDNITQSLNPKKQKPKSYEFPKELESEDPNSSSRKPTTDLPLTQTIRGVIDSFNEVFATGRLSQSNEMKRVPATTLDKVSSLNELVNQPNLKLFNQDTHESLDNLLQEYNEERSNEIRQMVDRVYAQKERYNDTIELIDGKLMVVNQTTGELTELQQSHAQHSSDSDSDAMDYDTAESGDEEGACCSKPKLRNRVNVWPRKWGPFTSADYQPAVQRMHQALVNNATMEFPKSQPDQEDSESEEFYSLDPQTKPSSFYANIDETFFENITFEQLKLSEDDENHIVQCARSYEELKHLFNVSHEDKSLTTEECELLADIQKKMEIRNEFQGSKDNNESTVQQEDHLLQKLMARTRESQVWKAREQQQPKPTSPNDNLATEKLVHRSSGDAIKIFEYNSGLNIEAREETEEQLPDTGICETLDNVYSFMYNEDVARRERVGTVSSRSTLPNSKLLKESLNRKEQLEQMIDNIQHAVGFTTQRSEGEKNELEQNVDEDVVLISNEEISAQEMTYVPKESQVNHIDEGMVMKPNEEIFPLEVNHMPPVLSNEENVENNGRTTFKCSKDISETENNLKDALKDEKGYCLQGLGSSVSRPENQKNYNEISGESSILDNNLDQDQISESISDDILCQSIPEECEPLISKPSTSAITISDAIKKTCHDQLAELSEQREDIKVTTNTQTTDLLKPMLSSNQTDPKATQPDMKITQVDITQDNCAEMAHKYVTEADFLEKFNIKSSEGSSAEMPHINATEANSAQLSYTNSSEGSSVNMSYVNITEDDAVEQSPYNNSLELPHVNAAEAKSPEMPYMNSSTDNSTDQPDIDILECNLEILDCNEEIIDTITVNAELRYNY